MLGQRWWHLVRSLQKGFVGALFFSFLAAVPAAAATWYVDGLNGDDTRDGLTPATAVQTIQVAIDRAGVEGDTVQVMAAPGHAYGPITFTNSPAGKQVKVIGAGPDVTRLTGSGTGSTVNGVTVETNAWGYVSGFTIEAWQYGVLMSEGATFTMTNCVVANNIYDGLYTGISNGWIVNLNNNVIASNERNGVWLRGSGSASLANNMIVSNITYGLTCNGNSLAITLHDSYSNYYNNTAGNTVFAGTSRTSSNNVSVSPSFVNTDVGNYHLLASSPAIDAGRPGASDLDPDGTRNNMGAWGGPGAALFWDDPAGGPVITTLVVTPSSVPQGGTISIEATAEIRSP